MELIEIACSIWIKPHPQIQYALKFTAQHQSGEINRLRMNYSRNYGIYSKPCCIGSF